MRPAQSLNSFGRANLKCTLATFWRKNDFSSGPRVVPDRSGALPECALLLPRAFSVPEGNSVSPECRSALSTPPDCQHSSHVDERVCDYPEPDPPFHALLSPISAAVSPCRRLSTLI